MHILGIIVEFMFYAFWNGIFIAVTCIWVWRKDLPDAARYFSKENREVRRLEYEARRALASKAISENMDTLSTLPERMEYAREMGRLEFRKQIALKEAEAIDAEKFLESKGKSA